MLNKQFMINWIAVFITLMAYGFIVYGILLGDYFSGTEGADMMRPAEERMMEWVAIASALMAYAFVRLFARHSDQSGVKDGIKFGLLMGVFWGSVELLYYANMPIPLNIALVSFAVDIGMFVASGIVLGIISSKRAN